MLGVILLYAIVLNVAFLILPNVVLLCAILLNVILLNSLLLNVILPSVILLIVIKVSVMLLNAMAPKQPTIISHFRGKEKSHFYQEKKFLATFCISAVRWRTIVLSIEAEKLKPFQKI
jgi:hypothetical protein